LCSISNKLSELDEKVMRVSEYIASRLAEFGVRHVFMLTGGGAMFLNDALGNQAGIQPVFNHHEQASSIAAEGYARITNTPGVVNVTTGPGGINAINGVFGAWVDSIPMLVISGQVKRETLVSSYDIPGLRQIGDQEADIIGMVKGITKYAVLVTDPQTIRYHLERAWHLCKSGRPGPCWLDIPIDVQSAKIDPDTLQGYSQEAAVELDERKLQQACAEVLKKLKTAERPVILAGKGIRLANALEDYEDVIRLLNIPVVPAWTSVDILASDDPLFGGIAGDLATRAGNFTVQNSDTLLVLGTRLSLRQVSYNWQSFARFAYKIQVDIDPLELKKPMIQIDMPIICDVAAFLKELKRQILASDYETDRLAKWLEWCRERVKRYPVVLPHYRKDANGKINPYYFIERLFTHLQQDDVVVCGDGTANVVTFQAASIKKGQRVFANSGDASMGYDLPAAVGAAVARGSGRVICLAGDGSLQLNIQELQTVVHNKLPIKLFVLNNDGYLSIRLSQKNNFKRLTGEGTTSGVSFPDIVKIAEAYGISALRVGYKDLDAGIERVLAHSGPMVCDVLLDPEQPFEPRVSARQLPDGRMVSSNLEDMSPFLDEREIAENMLISFDR
jgi:acetolactate synthase-1/2/3 large subunit